MEEGKNDEMKKIVGFKRMSGSSFEIEIGVNNNCGEDGDSDIDHRDKPDKLDFISKEKDASRGKSANTYTNIYL
jgi:hypothetical protein